MQPPAVEPRPQLLTYPDSLGGDLRGLGALLDGPLTGLFHGVHILPPFPSSGDRGFAPITYHEIEPRFGTWADIGKISAHHDVLLDLMINHLSRQSPEFQDFQRHGRRSRRPTCSSPWTRSGPTATQRTAMWLGSSSESPDSPFSTVTIEDTGGQERVWTSFGTADWSEQIDLDVTSAATESLITGWLRDFASHGVRMVRLDAVGYVIKKPGTSCFMVEPEIYAFLEWVDRSRRIVRPCRAARGPRHLRDPRAPRVARLLDLRLRAAGPAPSLLLLRRSPTPRLPSRRFPDRQFTTLDSHDGIPVWPDLEGILSPSEMRALADRDPAPGRQRQQDPVRPRTRKRSMSTS